MSLKRKIEKESTNSGTAPKASKVQVRETKKKTFKKDFRNKNLMHRVHFFLHPVKMSLTGTWGKIMEKTTSITLS